MREGHSTTLPARLWVGFGLIVLSLVIATGIGAWAVARTRAAEAQLASVEGLPGEEAAARRELHRQLDLAPWLLTGASVFILLHVAGGAVLLGSELARRVAREEEQARLLEVHRQLLAIVGHDLRSPLAAVLTTAQVIDRVPQVPPTARRAARRIVRSAVRMAEVIGDLLDFTRARLGGGIAVRPERTDVREACGRALEALRAQGADVGRVEVVHRADPEGEWDPDRLAQIVEQLVGNALRHAPAGTPVRLATEDVPGGLRLVVRNEGRPLPPALRERVFEPFERGADARDVRRSVGLGLFIVRALAEAHGGRVDVASVAGETVFIVELPRRARHRERAPHAGLLRERTA